MAEYKENLKSGGALIVSENTWYIQYYFPGIDLRHNGTFVMIDSNEIESYIKAFINNFQTYLKIKEVIPSGEYQKIGEMGMSIRLGWNEGVCIQSYHMPIDSKSKLDLLLTDYNYCVEKAKLVMEMLKQLNSH